MLEPMSEDLLPIGQFARLGRLSIKQLRRYDELGLLPPAHVDPDTGYRYYRPEQARDALAIGLLRSLDVPLPDVGKVLSGTAGVLEGVRDQLEAELERRRRTLATLERIMSGGLPGVEVRLIDQPAQHVAVTRESIADPGDIARATSACVARLLAGGTYGQLTGLFPLDLSGVFEVAVAMATDQPVPGARADVLPGGRFAAATHVGPYEQIGLTAHALLAWCAGRHPVTGPLREVYVSDPATTPPDHLVTHLLMPLEENA